MGCRCICFIVVLSCVASIDHASAQHRRAKAPARTVQKKAPGAHAGRPRVGAPDPDVTTGLPLGCVGATGDCCVPHGGLGCINPDCCDAVCSDDPFCCETKWDKFCVSAAAELCTCSVDNDLCTEPFQAFDGITSFTTVGASTDGPGHEACNFFSDNQVSQDVWYQYSATCTGDLTVTTCEQLGGGANYDTRLAMYDGCIFDPCPGGELLGCNDDDPDFPCGQPAGGFHSTLVVPVTEGNCYIIRIGGFDLDSGTGDLNVTCTPDIPTCTGATGACDEPNGTPGCSNSVCCTAVCETMPQCCADTWTQACVDQARATPQCGIVDNDLCIDAVQVSDGSIPFNTIGATTDGVELPVECDKGFGTQLGRDVWFEYAAPGPGLLTASTCADATFDTRLAIYDGCDCPATNKRLIGCDDDGCVEVEPGSVRSRVTVPIESDGCYLIRIGGYDEDSGTGALELSSTVDVDCPAGPVTWIEPADGVIDARQPHPTNSLDPPQGIQELRVAAPAAAQVTCWTLCESSPGGGDNGIDDVLINGDGTYTLVLQRPLTPGAVTEVSYNGGSAGRFIFHPGNTDGDSSASALDILSLVDFINGIGTSPWGAYSEDIDHSGLVTPADLLALIDLLNGADTQDAWLNSKLPAGPCQ